MNHWTKIYDKLFPKISRKNGLFASFVMIFKYMFVQFDDYVNKNINKDI